jgi:hypothetical protein
VQRSNTWHDESMTGRRKLVVQDKAAARGRAKRLRAKSFSQAAARGAGRVTGRGQRACAR